MQRACLVLLSLSVLAACAPRPEPIALGPQGPSGGLFISPMGEPFRTAQAGSDLIGAWFAGADTDGDGALTVAELQADAARFFRTLDTNGDGELTPTEMVRYEREVAPEIQLGNQIDRRRIPGMRRSAEEDAEPRDPQQFLLDRDGPPSRKPAPRLPQGAARYALLDIPQPVAAADSDFNRAVTAEEFAEAAKERFVQLDRDRDGRITRQELEPLPIAPAPPRSK